VNKAVVVLASIFIFDNVCNYYCLRFHIPVDKVVIDQESFSRLINTVSPGAYTSMTKISFGNLDKLDLRPIGVYGSKSEIVKLLRSLGAVNDELSVSTLSNVFDPKLIRIIQC
jgi:hypothetical protein